MTRAVALADYEAALASCVPARAASYIPHEPHPKQAEFLACEELEALYGGAAGGGKSDALLMAALRYVHVPGYSALILRRTFADLALPGAIMDRARAWLAGTDARWNDRDKTFTFPSGARLSFGYLDVERDRFRYQSAEFQFIGFDELTQFPEAWFRYMFSRLRGPAGGSVPLRMRSATNPGGIGHEWVRRRYIDGDKAFVPALLVDNPSVDAVAYRTSLAELDQRTRDQLEKGKWERDLEGLVYQFDAKRNACLRPVHLTRFGLGIDYGFTDSCAFVELGWGPRDRTVYITRVHREAKMTPSRAAQFVKAWSQERQYEFLVGDGGGLGKGYIEEARDRFALPIELAQKTNKRGYISLFNGELERGLVKVCEGCEDLVGEWAELPWNEDRSDYEPGFEDHLADAALYGWRASSAFLEKVADPAPEPYADAMEREEQEYEERLREARSPRRRNEWARRLA